MKVNSKRSNININKYIKYSTPTFILKSILGGFTGI